MPDRPTAPAEIRRGMGVEVVYTETRPPRTPEEAEEHGGWVTEEKTDTGRVTSVPSRKFDWSGDDFDFDYRPDTPGSLDAKERSVDLDGEQVRQLAYEGGGDRDWRQFGLVSVTVTGCRHD